MRGTGADPRTEQKKKGPRPKNRSTQIRKVKLSGCPVRALFWLAAAPVSFSSGAVLPAWSCRVPAPVSFSLRRCSLGSVFPCSFLRCCPPRGCFVSPCLGSRFLRCFLSLPGDGRNVWRAKGRRPYNRAFNRYPQGRYGQYRMGESYFWHGTVVLFVSVTYRVFPWLV